MWEFPKAVSLVAGAGEAATELNAFDRALMDAGIANLNFIKVTSIVPPGASVVPLPRLYPGMLVPAVYAQIVSHTPGERIAAALGVGICREAYGVIMEYSHMGTAENAELIVRRMVEEAFRLRQLRLDEVHVASREHVVERTGCVVAAALMWPAPDGAPPQGGTR
ncbi:MAG: arginine decarboxylase, pyruvoyl-dependent [Armatimonadota bacterium]|nr:arginine decarboxylase, pyruvoyl-dependent [Armatimonadota bacterium]MDR7427156.1 arginine decarboxylase, pyruvoyl-dependent [Armatimonadota bacterium]MDR7463978.1 arginine decarboxylase, pyruvoyl-dependent [Armatimonadota bacterium]MDR7470461.1 arginine decarboxylase, pyruvoyl-dependent [Armatimonadota bacterium]MDR7473561.1 arginine decarboxylase, pyruvoyl-dependent [Armatimonadota bacterium]